MMLPTDLLGRRYEFADGSAQDFTIVNYNTALDSCGVHFRDGLYGVRQHLRLSVVLKAIKAGAIQESDLAPFVADRRRTQ